MATDTELDDAVDQDEEDKAKPKPKPKPSDNTPAPQTPEQKAVALQSVGTPIGQPSVNPAVGTSVGNPILSNLSSTGLENSQLVRPDTTNTSAPPPQVAQPNGISTPSVGTPIGQAQPSPYGSQEYLNATNKLNTLNANPYHPSTVGKILNALALSTKFGPGIEAATGTGPIGHDVKVASAEKGVEDINKQIEQQEKSGQTEALTNEANARAEATKAGTQDVTVTLPNGQLARVPAKDAERLFGTMLTQQGAGERTAETVTGREKVANINATAKEGNAHYADLDVNGKKVPGKVDAKGNLLMADGSPAPKGTTEYKAPTYAEVMGGRLTNIMVDGVPTEVQLQPGGGIKAIGEAGGGTFAGRVSQAKVVQSAGDQVIKDIEAHKDKLGNVQSIVSAALLGTPLADPETQALAAEIGSYVALHPAMHGFRGTSALEHFSNLIGGIPNNPDALIAGIQGLSKMAGIFTEPGQGAGEFKVPADAPAAPKADGKLLKDNKGNVLGVSKGGQWQAPAPTR